MINTRSLLDGAEADLWVSIFLVLSYAPCGTEMQQVAERFIVEPHRKGETRNPKLKQFQRFQKLDSSALCCVEFVTLLKSVIPACF